MKKQFTAIISLLVLTIVLISMYNINSLESKIKAEQYSRLVNDLSKVTTDFGAWISKKVQALNTAKDIVDNFSLEEITEMSSRNFFLDINNDDPDISQIYIGLDNGDFITGSEWIPPDDYDPRERVWYKDAVIAEETIISRVYIDRETEELLVTISSPLHINETFVGVISTDVFLSNINDYLKKSIEGEKIYTYLLDKEGTFIAHTDKPELIGQNIYTDLKNKVYIDYFEQVKQTSKIVELEYAYQEQEIRGIVQKIVDVDWYMAVATEEEDQGFFERIIDKNLILNMGIVIVILILIYFISRMKSVLYKTNKTLVSDNEKDFLTGIHNRRYLDISLENIWESARDKNDLSLLMIDIDNFKEYNDTYGHMKGDEVLKLLSNSIKDLLRKEDVFARYGGEEFVVVLNNVLSEEAVDIADKIRLAVYELNIIHNKSPYYRVTISIGVSTIFPSTKTKIEHLLNAADIALYEAKNNGRNNVHVNNYIS